MLHEIQAAKLELSRAIGGLEHTCLHWKKACRPQTEHFYHNIVRLERALERIDILTRGKAKQKQQVEWKGFVNVRMGEAEREQFVSWDCHDNDVFVEVAGLLNAGYKVTANLQNDMKTVNVSATGTSINPTNAGYTVSAYAADYYTALRVLLFKVLVIMPADWSELETNSPTADFG